MELNYQQRQLLELLDDMDACGQEGQVNLSARVGTSGETGEPYFHVEGVRPAQDGTGLPFEKKYPAEYVYPLQAAGYVGMENLSGGEVDQPRDGDEFALWVTPEGVRAITTTGPGFPAVG